jgi:hypothetical protein
MVMLTSAKFQVTNGITKLQAAESIDEIEIEKFGSKVDVPKKPTFKIDTFDGSSLFDMENAGIQVFLKLQLKGVSSKVQKESAIVKELKMNAKKQAMAQADDAKKASEEAAKRLAQKGIENAAEKVVNAVPPGTAAAIFKLTEEDREQCLMLPGLAAPDLSVQAASMADAVAANPDVIGPQQMLTSFVHTLTGGGGEMKPEADMAVMLDMDLAVSDLSLSDDGTYTVETPLNMIFEESYEYQCVLGVNGVVGQPEDFPAFKVVLKKVPVGTEIANWFCSSIAAILSVILLTTNTRTHKWHWFLFAMLSVAGVMTMCVFLEEYKKAIGGHWLVIAEVALGLTFAALVWGLVLEKKPDWLTFEERRLLNYKDYTQRRMHSLLAGNPESVPGSVALKDNLKRMFRKFDAQDAFFFPTKLLISMFISLLSFVYILLQAIQMLEKVNSSLKNLLNRSLHAILQAALGINDQYYQATGTDLPDSATSFLYKQLDLVKDWFMELIKAIEIGMTVGVVIAGIVVFLSLLFTFFDFRRRALLLRMGVPTFAKKFAKIEFEVTFIGQMIASVLIGFLIIVLVFTLVVIPFAWPVTFNIIWDMKWFIIKTFVIPAAISVLQQMLLKKTLFETFIMRHRPLAAMYVFQQTWLSLLGGVFVSILRCIMALVSSILLTPALCDPVTPARLNELVLLDAGHKAYISAVMSYHTHNHPIMITASRLFLEIAADCEEKYKSSFIRNRIKSRYRNKFWVGVILKKFPELIPLRKKVLQEERDAKKNKKKGGDNHDATSLGTTGVVISTP